jgi:hypothetical protein
MTQIHNEELRHLFRAWAVRPHQAIKSKDGTNMMTQIMTRHHLI